MDDTLGHIENQEKKSGYHAVPSLRLPIIFLTKYRIKTGNFAFPGAVDKIPSLTFGEARSIDIAIPFI